MRIEVSPSGRATCRGCKKPIAKGELRFAETYTMPGTDTEAQRYFHLPCAAEKAAAPFAEALQKHEGDVPDRAALLEKAQGAAKKGGRTGPKTLPFADRAPTGRARCIQCEKAVAKGAWRVAVEREIDTGSFVTKGAGYLHPACIGAWAEAEPDAAGDLDAFTKGLVENSGLGPEEQSALLGELAV